MQYLGAISKTTELSLIISNPSLCPDQLTSSSEKVEVEWFYEDLQDLLELTPKKDVLFIIRDWNAKARDTWSNRQMWPWEYKMKHSKG